MGSKGDFVDTVPSGSVITSTEELRALVGGPVPRAADKVRRVLDECDREWLAQSPFCMVATSGADGCCDVSPKGDPPGFTLVLDDTTIAIPERPGKRRVDGVHNVLANPHIGLLYMIPGQGDTLRINGSAHLVSDAPYLEQMLVAGHRPRVVVVVQVEEIFFHCSKAYLRSRLWEPASWNPTAVRSRAKVAHRLERPDEELADLERYYGPQYVERLYPQSELILGNRGIP